MAPPPETRRDPEVAQPTSRQRLHAAHDTSARETPEPETLPGALRPASAVPAAPRPASAVPAAPTDLTELLAVVCPYLRSADGGWRSSQPHRDHRCTGVRPPAPLPILTQKRLCVTVEHAACETYLAARAQRRAELEAAHVEPDLLASTRFRALTRPLPLVVDRAADRVAPGGGLPAPRTLALGGGAAFVVVAFLALTVLQRPAPSPGGVARSSPTPPPVASAPLSPVPTRPPATPAQTAAPSAGPTASATAVTTRRYRVLPGETLRTIAQRFGTTAAVLRALNRLGRGERVEVGQVILVPVRQG